MFDELKKIRSKSVVVMHDFFIDRIVRLNDFNSLISEVNAKSRVGGGSIRGIEQIELKGGNAVNVAYSLAKLGARTTLLTVADSFGKNILKNTFAPLKNAKLLIRNGRQGYTVSFEVERGGKPTTANVMISDVGDTGNFGGDKLRKNEVTAIRRASAVVITNWASNKKGTELALKAFRNGKGALCFLDPADVATRKNEFKGCLEKLSGYIDVLSVNENECRLIMQSLSLPPLPHSYSQTDIVSGAKKLASRLSINVDVHTPQGSTTSNGKETSFVKSLNVKVAISTGAGDIWDAADIAGYLCNLDASERLSFANACAAFYISNMVSPKIGEVQYNPII